MLRRVPAPIAALAVAALALAAWPAPSRASDIPFDGPQFTLKNNGTTPIKQVFAIVEPPGKLAQPLDANGKPTAPDFSTSPAQIGALRVFGDSTGFDVTRLSFGVANGSVEGQPKQAIGLTFDAADPTKNLPDGPGLQPGGTLHFGLQRDSGYTGGLDLQLVDSLQTLNPLTNGALTLLPVTPPTNTGTDPGTGTGNGTPTTPPTDPGPTPTTNTPEPFSVAIWSALAGLGLLRARSFRRAHRPA